MNIVDLADGVARPTDRIQRSRNPKRRIADRIEIIQTIVGGGKGRIQHIHRLKGEGEDI